MIDSIFTGDLRWPSELDRVSLPTEFVAIGKKNFPRCRFFLTVQSSNLLQLREPVGEDARASEKFVF
jgi:hypothetical protein